MMTAREVGFAIAALTVTTLLLAIATLPCAASHILTTSSSRKLASKQHVRWALLQSSGLYLQ
jgi:hypothetical protein